MSAPQPRIKMTQTGSNARSHSRPVRSVARSTLLSRHMTLSPSSRKKYLKPSENIATMQIRIRGPNGFHWHIGPSWFWGRFQDLHSYIGTRLRQSSFRPVVDEPPSVVYGGKGVVVFGCSTCLPIGSDPVSGQPVLQRCTTFLSVPS